MLDLDRLAEFDAVLGTLSPRVPGLTRDLPQTHEAPAQGRGGVSAALQVQTA
jgi:hypothetical protein